MNEEEYVRGFYDGLEKRYSSNTAYSDGFKAGQRNEREYILSFIEDHEGSPITLDDIIQEIEGRYKREQNEVLRGLGL
jgi:hypothetical protein